MTEITLSKKEILSRLNNIIIQPLGFKQRRYGVSVKHFSNLEETPSKRIDYEVTADLNIEDGKGILRLNKENIFYNQHQPDFINEIISTALSGAIYPVETFMNEKGIHTGEISNHDEILKRWEIQKSNLSQKYSSDSLTHFFLAFEEKLNNKFLLGKSLHHDWFWNLFFHPRLINYGDKRTVEKDVFLSVIPYQDPLKFSGTQKIEKIPVNKHTFTIHFESKEIPAPTYFHPENYTAEAPVLMTLKVIFDQDLYHHFPMNTIAELEIYSKDGWNHKTPIKKIVFSMYQINTDEYKTKKLSNDSPFITGGLVIVPPNKWGFDNFEGIENDW